MSIPDGQAEGGEALAREAAHWFARLRSPDAEASRDAFKAWLAEGAEHRAAYNRAAEIFAMGKLLAEVDEPVPVATRRPGALAVALGLAAALVVGIGGWVVSRPATPAADQRGSVAGATDHRTLSTIAGEASAVRLADGSTVRLDRGTVLDVDIGGGQRNLRLRQGQARFEVAHEQRPFIVFAGGGSVTARGTIFEVALTRSGKVAVRLLQGAVDVALPRQAPMSPSAVRKLSVGEGISFAAQPQASPSPVVPIGATTAPSSGARDFEATPVSELVALANHGAARPIRMAGTSLAAQRVSGRFRIDDTELLARRLAALFGGHVDASDPHELVLMPATSQASVSEAVDDRHAVSGG
ncbi:FecR domain-containing protein [Sphingomonas sp. QA11]|uniref:FecR family protein n=1 Tax=Sphingomonas sp. QA11 TaxID=2950605 RepID=UPI002349F253|nr:FecR domain-containing protein [Sphingomonas sp. QA11]WCM26346.1 FecR domain-containing protein [Sphingomonas sp. QA11]